MSVANDIAAEIRAERDESGLHVVVDVDVRYVVDAAWLRRQMGDNDSPIDEVARAYCDAVECGEMDVPYGHVEFATIEYDLRAREEGRL